MVQLIRIQKWHSQPKTQYINVEYWTFHGLFVIEIISIREPIVKAGSAYWVFGYSRTL